MILRSLGIPSQAENSRYVLNLAGIDGLLELYNVFNHANYGTYGGLGSLGGSGSPGELASNYGKPVQNTNPAYLPRVLQLGFRFTF